MQEVYGKKELGKQYDAVVTCFFIDTAANVVDYIDVIHNVLRPGGVWLNFGPLLWHWQVSWFAVSVCNKGLKCRFEMYVCNVGLQCRFVLKVCT